MKLKSYLRMISSQPLYWTRSNKIKKSDIYSFLRFKSIGCRLNRVDSLNAINAIFCFENREKGILIDKIESTITDITKDNPPMDNNTRKLINLTDHSLIFNED